MDEYSKECQIQYDWVLQLRFDLFFREPMPFLTLDRSKFYSCPRFQIDKDIAINDVWFLSNQKDAKKFSGFYSKIKDYSIWVHAASKQHIDSEGIQHGEFPDRVFGKRNYWMIREVLKSEEEEEVTFFYKIAIAIKFRVKSALNKIINLLTKVSDSIN